MAKEIAIRSRRDKPIQRWPGYLAFLAIGLIFSFLSARITNGLGWLTLPVIVIFLGLVNLTHFRGKWALTRGFAFVITTIITLVELVSIGFLLKILLTKEAMGLSLLQDAVLLWVTNVVIFSLWYWELDGGGPIKRHKNLEYHRDSDFLFPQLISTRQADHNWIPIYIDYLYLAFNTNTAFSPADTPVLTNRAKILTMLQSGISLITLVAFAARAINIL